MEVKLLALTRSVLPDNLTDEQIKLLSDPRVIAGESARTCYSSTLFEPTAYLDEKHRRVTDQVIESTRASGHLTTREHVNFTFGLQGVSRQLLWSFLHSHPHYNSEQQSQRYVTIKPGNFFVPEIDGKDLVVYERTVAAQMAVYQQLSDILKTPVASEYFKRFPRREKYSDKWQGEIQKKAQEVARYVLPVATLTNLYHTISSLTLMRLARACDQYDVPREAKIVVSKMVNSVVKEVGTGFLEEISDPIPLSETPEAWILDWQRNEVDCDVAKKAVGGFDQILGGLTSKLVGYTSNAEQILRVAARNVMGVTADELDDEETIMQVLDPLRNKTLGDTLNVTTLSKLARAGETVSYTLVKKLSHTADSQNQRHRMTPAARPILATHYTGELDFITPALIAATPEAQKLYEAIMEQTFEAVNKLLDLGVSFENASYLLPNALAIRLMEQGTLSSLHHKYRMRLCLNAQEEIWRASCEEVEQIRGVHPEIGKWLLPPCAVRSEADITPVCPEGSRYCGVQVWKQNITQYNRLI